jgi:predicted PurR-regulated permease PerM
MRDVLRIDITWASILRVVVIALSLLVLYIAREAVGVLLLAVVISLGVGPFVSFFERLRLGRLFGTFIVFLIGILALVTVGYFVVPVIIVELGAFVAHIGDIMRLSFGAFVPNLAFSNVSAWLSDAAGLLGASNLSITGTVGAILNRAILAIATIIIAFYLTIEKDGVERLMRGILPAPYEQKALDIFSHFRTKIRHWFTAQLGLSLLMGLIVGLGSWALGLKYPLVLGLIAAVLELVPVVGSIITGTVAFLIAVTDSFSLGLYTVILFIVIQQLENHLLVPVVMGRTVEVHPLMVILALLIGGKLAGVLGVFLAVPLAVLVQEMLNHFAEQKRQRPALDV